jgi:hypothetical protein
VSGIDQSIRIEVGGDLHESGGLDGNLLTPRRGRGAERSWDELRR